MAAYEALSARAGRLIKKGRYDEAMRLLLKRHPPGAQTART